MISPFDRPCSNLYRAAWLGCREVVLWRSGAVNVAVGAARLALRHASPTITNIHTASNSAVVNLQHPYDYQLDLEKIPVALVVRSAPKPDSKPELDAQMLGRLGKTRKSTSLPPSSQSTASESQ